MITINVTLKVRDANDVNDVRMWLIQHAQLSRAEPGCQRFELYESESEPQVFLINERWNSQEALDTHREAEGFTTIYEPQVLPKVNRVAHIAKLIEG